MPSYLNSTIGFLSILLIQWMTFGQHTSPDNRNGVCQCHWSDDKDQESGIVKRLIVQNEIIKTEIRDIRNEMKTFQTMMRNQSKLAELEKELKAKISTFDTSLCPSPDLHSSVEFPPQCCSFPFTFNRQLHHRCIPKPDGLFGCLIARRIWVTCAEPTDYVAHNRSLINTTIPAVARFTTTSIQNWIVFQQKKIEESLSFNRSWEDFKIGFGRPDGNFWMGLEKIHRITNSAPYRLRIEFMLTNESWYSAEYDTFRVESEEENYQLNVTGYSGDAGDVLNSGPIEKGGFINGMNFSTYDRDNDRGGSNCALNRGGGWWYNHCAYLHLNNANFKVHLFFVDGSWHNLTVSRMMMMKSLP